MASTADIERRAASGDPEAQFALAVQCETEGRGDQAVKWFRCAAKGGDTKAKAVLAMRLLSFSPYDEVEAARWANEAAREGNAEATHLLAIVTAEGLGGIQQSWPSALDYLERSAELGHQRARMELAALAGNWLLAQDIRRGRVLSPAEWRRLRASIDLAGLFRIPHPEIASSAPRIALVQSFLAPQMCDWLINVGRPILKRAQIVDYHSGGARNDPARDNSATVLMPGMGDLLISLARARIAVLTGLPVTGFEPTAVLQYKVGEQFHPHHDFLPAIGARYKGRKGNALFFWNVASDGAPDLNTFHAGLPPTRGEKWLLSQWIRLRAS